MDERALERARLLLVVGLTTVGGGAWLALHVHSWVSALTAALR